MRSFAQYRIGYAVAVLLALFFVFVLGKPSQHGFAVGLLLLAALGLTIDFFAERRAEQYLQALQAGGRLAWLIDRAGIRIIPTWQAVRDRLMMQRINTGD